MTRRGIEWLSSAADNPDKCRSQWASDPRHPYALPTGRLFDVVVVGQRLGMETFDQLLRHDMPLGPVAVDQAAKKISFFLEPELRRRFTNYLDAETADPPHHTYLDEGSVVVAPGPMPLSSDRYQWLRAPARPLTGHHLRAAGLAVMLVAAAALIERVDKYDEDCSAAAVDPLPKAASHEH
ncbi:bifunctional DNA primase/polymerase [Actinacidiphila oryziradicis]|uniref:DNA primase/polymerase bifunctional N-terminal domain-containing protein n=1 Tax=Actinacidiphila oryziradicis TaxID=2571141 RepID=A0A4U0SB08_9ACTN|nr:bifunctional DNA primase/polymerase [Actinacidiphila oryziradicis]TKA04561.1 hypothetical protein FCI23_36005 [Actinacidiphila oryziradicis]